MHNTIACTVYPFRGTAFYGYTELNNALEIKYNKQRYISNDDNNPRSWVYINNYCSTSKIYAVTRSQVPNNDVYGYSPESSSDPTNMWY